ncbi:MAG: hypothetical protein N4A33_08960 [Bacteriovoracaceae bacterium]|jgi:hypothetical protein|nr:hypothetical protein [Bacteriovoracaceae bacterium]
MKLFIIFLIALSNLFAQTSRYVDIGYNTSDDEADKKLKDNISSAQVKRKCTSKDQSSLPLSHLLGLIPSKQKEIVIGAASNGDVISASLNSPIIGNCSSMLMPTLKYDSSLDKYIYEVKIRKNCEGSSPCDYSVTYRDDKTQEIKQRTKAYLPTLSGFYKCMEENVGIKEVEGKRTWDKSKLLREELKEVTHNANVTAEVIYASKGPIASESKKVNSQKNLFENNECYFYEKIDSVPTYHLSRSDVELNALHSKAQVLCQKQDYKAIENGLEAFLGNDQLYENLLSVRNKLLLDEMKKAKENFDSHVKDEDLSQLDIDYYNQVMKDFKRLIVDKNFSDKNHDDIDTMNPNLLVNMIKEYNLARSNGNYDYAKELKEKISQKTDELADYIKEPYFTAGDYKKLTLLTLKPKLNSKKWKDTSKIMHQNIITLKLACEAYGSGKSCKEVVPKTKNFKIKESRLVSLGSLHKKANEFNQVAMDNYDDKLKLITKPNSYKSIKYEKLLSECKNQTNVSQGYSQAVMRQSQQIMQQCQQKSGGNQYALRSCISKYEEQIKTDVEALNYEMENCKKMKAHYEAQKSKWKSLEAQRDEYLGLTKEQKEKKQKAYSKELSPTKPEYNFKFQGGQNRGMASSNLGLNGGYNSSFQTSMYPQFNMNSGFQNNMYPQFSMNSGYNNGMNSSLYNNPSMYYGMQGSFMSGASFGGFNNNQYSVPMGLYQNGWSAPGGSMNFMYGPSRF